MHMFNVSINMFEKFHKIRAMTLQRILRKQNVSDGRTGARTDNVKTVYPRQTKFAGGIKHFFRTGLSNILFSTRIQYSRRI